MNRFMQQRWMAEIHYRDGADLVAPNGTVHTNPQIVAFEEIADLHSIVNRGPDWNDIERIVITLNRASRDPAREPI
jgi:hypothetical protein